MSYYTALTVAWNSSTQPPAGVTGVGLTSTMSTATKLAEVNAWAITGVIPSSMYATGSQLANCINWSEFNAKTATQQANLLALCNNPGQLLGGSANVSLLTAGMFVAVFGSSSVTIANLTALAQASVTPWTAANGYSVLNNQDLIAAGGLT